MKANKSITLVLLLFLLGSFAYLAVRSGRQQPPSLQAAAPEKVPAAPAGPAGAVSTVVAYYFHATVRCPTCRMIETQSREIIQERFANELASGRLQWKPVNVEEPANRHFIQDYQLFTRSLVLALFKDGQQQGYKVLNDVWRMVGNRTLMQRYVENEVRAFLEKL